MKRFILPHAVLLSIVPMVGLSASQEPVGIPFPSGRVQTHNSMSLEQRLACGKFSTNFLSSDEMIALQSLFVEQGRKMTQSLVDEKGNNALHLRLLLKLKKQAHKESVPQLLLRTLRKFSWYYTGAMLEAVNAEQNTPYDLFERFHRPDHNKCSQTMRVCFELWFKKRGLLGWTPEEEAPRFECRTPWGIVRQSVQDRCLAHGDNGKLIVELRTLKDAQEKKLKFATEKDREAIKVELDVLVGDLKEASDCQASRKQWFLKQRVVASAHIQEGQ